MNGQPSTSTNLFESHQQSKQQSQQHAQAQVQAQAQQSSFLDAGPSSGFANHGKSFSTRGRGASFSSTRGKSVHFGGGNGRGALAASGVNRGGKSFGNRSAVFSSSPSATRATVDAETLEHEEDSNVEQVPTEQSVKPDRIRDEQDRKIRFEQLPKDNRFFEMRTQREALRAQYIQQGILPDPDKPTDLAAAKTLTGTCMEMCPEFEREEREFQNEGDALEMFPGTSRIDPLLAVKIYRRPAAGRELPLPEDVRPPSVLQRTLDYLVHDLLPSDPGSSRFTAVQPFMWNRTRAIRQDFIVQGERGALAIECHERIARYHILCLHWRGGIGAEGWSEQQELEQLRKTIRSLTEFYEDMRRKHNRSSPNEAEFRAYNLLLHIHDPETLREVELLPESIGAASSVQAALKLRTYAQRSNNVIRRGRPRNTEATANLWTRFFGELRRRDGHVTYLLACLAENSFSAVRAGALKAMSKTYLSQHAPLPLDFLKRSLGMDSEDAAREFAVELGAEEVFTADGTITGLRLGKINDEKPLPMAPFSQSVVEAKRGTLTLQDVIDGTGTRLTTRSLSDPTKAPQRAVSFSAQRPLPSATTASPFTSTKQSKSNVSNQSVSFNNHLSPAASAPSPVPDASNVPSTSTSTSTSAITSTSSLSAKAPAFAPAFTQSNSNTQGSPFTFSVQGTSLPTQATPQTVPRAASQATSFTFGIPSAPVKKIEISIPDSTSPAKSPAKEQVLQSRIVKAEVRKPAAETVPSPKPASPAKEDIRKRSEIAIQRQKRTKESVSNALFSHLMSDLLTRKVHMVSEQACLREHRIRKTTLRDRTLAQCTRDLYAQMMEELMDERITMCASETIADERRSRNTVRRSWIRWKQALDVSRQRTHQTSRLHEIRTRLQARHSRYGHSLSPTKARKKTFVNGTDDEALQVSLRAARKDRSDVWMPSSFLYACATYAQHILISGIEDWTVGLSSLHPSSPSGRWLRVKLSLDKEPHAEVVLRSDACVHAMDLTSCSEEDIEEERNLGLLIFELDAALDLMHKEAWGAERNRLEMLSASSIVKQSRFLPKLFVVSWLDQSKLHCHEENQADQMRKMIVKQLGLVATELLRHNFSQVVIWQAGGMDTSPQQSFENKLEQVLSAPIEWNTKLSAIAFEDVLNVCSSQWRAAVDRVGGCISKMAGAEGAFEVVLLAFNTVTALCGRVLDDVASVSELVHDENRNDWKSSVPFPTDGVIPQTYRASVTQTLYELALTQVNTVFRKNGDGSSAADASVVLLLRTWLLQRQKDALAFPWSEYFGRLLQCYVVPVQQAWIEATLPSLEAIDEQVRASNELYIQAARELEWKVKMLMRDQVQQQSHATSKKEHRKRSGDQLSPSPTSDDSVHPASKVRRTTDRPFADDDAPMMQTATYVSPAVSSLKNLIASANALLEQSNH